MPQMSKIMVAGDDPLMPFIYRGCKGELQGQEWQRMNDILIELTPDNLNSTLEKCYENQRQGIVPSFHLFFIILRFELWMSSMLYDNAAYSLFVSNV